jgi:hypothetical protein
LWFKQKLKKLAIYSATFIQNKNVRSGEALQSTNPLDRAYKAGKRNATKDVSVNKAVGPTKRTIESMIWILDCVYIVVVGLVM